MKTRTAIAGPTGVAAAIQRSDVGPEQVTPPWPLRSGSQWSVSVVTKECQTSSPLTTSERTKTAMLLGTAIRNQVGKALTSPP